MINFSSNYRQDLLLATQTLQSGKTLLYPTDTVWGIGCDATNDEAVKTIYTIKKRSESKSLIILVNSLDMLQQYVSVIPKNVLSFLSEQQRPTTVIYWSPRGLAKNVIAENNTVAIRWVKDGFCHDLITTFGKPIVSTSANISGEPTPSCFDEISEKIRSACDYVVQHRQNDYSKHQPSQLIQLENDGSFTISK